MLGVAVGVAPVSEKVGTEGGCVEEGWEVGAEVDAPNLKLQRVRWAQGLGIGERASPAERHGELLPRCRAHETIRQEKDEKDEKDEQH